MHVSPVRDNASASASAHQRPDTVAKIRLLKSTPNLLTFFEMGRNPLHIQWLARTLRYWNKLVGLSPRSLLGPTLLAGKEQIQPAGLMGLMV